MLFHYLCGNEHAKRAAEVALAGDHRIVFMGPPEGDAKDFAKLVEQGHREISDMRDTHFGYHWQPCPCGYFSLTSYECTCSDETISAWQHMNPLQMADIYITVLRPPTEKLIHWAKRAFTYGELHAQIMTRVKQARLRGMGGPHEFADVAWSLLSSATHQLVLHTSQLRSTVAVAKTIARLAGANQVEAAHMAEAIQYRPRSSNLPPLTDN